MCIIIPRAITKKITRGLKWYARKYLLKAKEGSKGGLEE
jgi:hypothetical protein